MTKPLLTLTTLEPERQTVAIDGASYELALPGDFGIAAQAKLARMQRRVNALIKREDELSDAELDELGQLVDALVSLLLPALPAETLGMLRDSQKLQIVNVFTTAAGITGENPSPIPTSETLSPDSSGSTEAAPATG